MIPVSFLFRSHELTYILKDAKPKAFIGADPYLEEISRVLEGVPFERVVAGGGGVHIYGPFLREVFGDNLVMLEDRFAQADGCRLFLEHYQTLRAA